MTANMMQYSKSYVVRSGIRTHAHRSGLRPERSALDHSAILTLWVSEFLRNRNPTLLCPASKRQLMPYLMKYTEETYPIGGSNGAVVSSFDSSVGRAVDCSWKQSRNP